MIDRFLSGSPALVALPFVGLLLSIALMPLFAPTFWHRHFGKMTAVWALLFIIPSTLQFGTGQVLAQLAHALLLEYLPFIIVLFALYTIAGGICVKGNLHGTPLLNTGLLAIGTLLVSVMGTTGAAMLMIRPVIRANDNRVHKVHVLIFFIFLVCNAGGALTPLGDPPLFLGFLKGVDFFWTLRHLWAPMLTLCGLLLAGFFVLDTWLYRRAGEERPALLDPTPDHRIHLLGGINLLLLSGVVAAVLVSGLWKPGLALDVFGTSVELQNLMRDGALVLLALISLAVTPNVARAGNDFNWAPMLEVSKLFLGIFITIIPVIALLHAGEGGGNAGPFNSIGHWLVRADGEPDSTRYFWLTGLLSAFLDNAPTYLVFFNLAGGDAEGLMRHVATLAAISGGAVFMGALTYIGNAPNFMVKAIAENHGIAMPSFLAYMAWSVVILIPAFWLLTILFFR